MSIDQERLEKIRTFVDRGRSLEKQYGESPLSLDANQQYSRRLDDTIRSLQEHVKLQEDALRQLRATKQGLELNGQNTESTTRLIQVRRVKKAYDSLLQTEPDLPAPDSPLPCLIALRETARVIQETKSSISNLRKTLPSTRQNLKDEQEDLEDANRIHDGLQARIERIRNEQSERSAKTPSQLAEDFVAAERKKTRVLRTSSTNIKKDLYQFIDDHLASQLAAENLGGPTVGEVMQISDIVLEAGYTAHGKPKKPKGSLQHGNDEDPRQQRIDDILRRRQGDDESSTRPTNRRETASAAMHTLIDSLIEAGTSYVDLPNESAESRFLVRAKVAQLHPRDARKIRLIDFGRSFENY